MGKVDWKDPEAKDRLIAALWLGTGGGVGRSFVVFVPHS